MGRHSCKKYSATSDWPGGIGCHRLTEKPDNTLLVQEGGFVQVIASEHNANNTVLECAKLARGIAQIKQHTNSASDFSARPCRAFSRFSSFESLSDVTVSSLIVSACSKTCRVVAHLY
jgi:hypothetical protein